MLGTTIVIGEMIAKFGEKEKWWRAI